VGLLLDAPDFTILNNAVKSTNSQIVLQKTAADGQILV